MDNNKNSSTLFWAGSFFILMLTILAINYIDGKRLNDERKNQIVMANLLNSKNSKIKTLSAELYRVKRSLMDIQKDLLDANQKINTLSAAPAPAAPAVTAEPAAAPAAN